MEKLDKIYENQFEIYELLNTIAINGKKPKTKIFFLNIIKQVYSCDDTKAKLIFEQVEDVFSKKINYFCEIEEETETFSSTFLQEICNICNEKVENHEHFILYKFDKEKELSDFNTSLLEKFFFAESVPVVKDLKSNFSSLIPFIGAGISKELGFPLWLEMLKSAKKTLADVHHHTFDTYYERGDIDKLIEFIKDFSSSLNTDKKIKKELILPQVRLNLSKDIIKNSTAHYILKLDSPYVITTNYDKALEKINTEFNLNYNESKNLYNFSGFEDLDKDKFIFHIHGDISHLDTMIVTNDDYETMYKDSENKRVLTGLIMRSSLLFMGFSLNDQYFSKEFSKICLANKDYAKNYMICLENGATSNLIKENINYITIKTSSINKNQYDSAEQYRYLLNYIKGQIFIKTDYA